MPILKEIITTTLPRGHGNFGHTLGTFRHKLYGKIYPTKHAFFPKLWGKLTYESQILW